MEQIALQLSSGLPTMFIAIAFILVFFLIEKSKIKKFELHVGKHFWFKFECK